VPGHPSDEAISDALGGAIPAPPGVTRSGVAFWQRETCVTEGLDRNRTAAVLARASGAFILPFMGPVAMTTAVPGPNGLVSPECFPEHVVTAMLQVCHDVDAALAGADDGFTTPGLSAWWAGRVRETGHLADVMDLPDNWPYPPVTDPVAELFRKLGLQVADAPNAVGT
jgi:hypothetical protein